MLTDMKCVLFTVSLYRCIHYFAPLALIMHRNRISMSVRDAGMLTDLRWLIDQYYRCWRLVELASVPQHHTIQL